MGNLQKTPGWAPDAEGVSVRKLCLLSATLFLWTALPVAAMEYYFQSYPENRDIAMEGTAGTASNSYNDPHWSSDVSLPPSEKSSSTESPVYSPFSNQSGSPGTPGEAASTTQLSPSSMEPYGAPLGVEHDGRY